MLLADFQDPTVVPDLIAMLANKSNRARVAMRLSSITGLELTEVNGREAFIKAWWRTHQNLPQALWFMESLKRYAVETTLTVEQLAPHAGHEAVPELTRIMLGTDKPHLRVLAAALLRTTTEREFGLISMQTRLPQLQAIADRYRFYAKAEGTSRDR